MHIRRVAPDDRERILTFLDSRTVVLRWLVAFFRHRDRLPPEEDENWDFFLGEEEDLVCLAAHFLPSATSYVCSSIETGFGVLEALVAEELLPEKLVGERDFLERWRAASPEFFAAAREGRLEALTFQGSGSPPPGFRAALPADLPLLEQYERLRAIESGEETTTDLEALIDAGLLFVFETEGVVAGVIRSNLSDGKYVHAGGVYVHPVHRGKGVGRFLAEGLGAKVRAEQNVAALVTVDVANGRALRAYRSAGYVPVGEGIEFHFDPESWDV